LPTPPLPVTRTMGESGGNRRAALRLSAMSAE
jgi:hypothetical protein